MIMFLHLSNRIERREVKPKILGCNLGQEVRVHLRVGNVGAKVCDAAEAARVCEMEVDPTQQQLLSQSKVHDEAGERGERGKFGK